MASAADSDSSDLTLGQLLARGISSATKVTDADSPNDPIIQKLLQSSLSDLTLCSSLISRLGILSPNETLEDINTRDLRCVLVDCLRGELEVLAKTKGGVERIGWLQRARDNFRNYLELVDRYEIIPEEKRSAFAGPQHATQNPTVRREHKIAQYKLEKEIKGKLEELRKRRQERRPRTRASTSTATTLTAPEEDTDDLAYDSDSDDADVSRPLFITLLQLHYLRAHAELSSMEQELELLVHGMKMSDVPTGRDARGREEGREKEDEGSWRVERLDQREGPLLDQEGKVLRPFTILPSHKTSSPLSTRLRFSSEVFRPSHNLPTMTIDEFLEQEEAAGNILQGGGPNSSEAVEAARKEEQGEKEEDNLRGWEEEERTLGKTREWDEYRDTHRKGEGNMHNRG